MTPGIAWDVVVYKGVAGTECALYQVETQMRIPT